VQAIGSALNAAHATAAASTTTVVAAAQDEVSAAIAALFGSYAQGYQTLAGRAAAFHDWFTRNLHSGANSYAATEAANVSPLNAGLEKDVLALEQQYRVAVARGDTQTAEKLMPLILKGRTTLSSLKAQQDPFGLAANVQVFTSHATSAASTVETPPQAVQSEISTYEQLVAQLEAQKAAQLNQNIYSSVSSDQQTVAQLEQEQLLLQKQAALDAQKARTSAAIAIAAGVADVSRVSEVTILHAPPPSQHQSLCPSRNPLADRPIGERWVGIPPRAQAVRSWPAQCSRQRRPDR
jgi:hypothetical protein